MRREDLNSGYSVTELLIAILLSLVIWNLLITFSITSVREYTAASEKFRENQLLLLLTDIKTALTMATAVVQDNAHTITLTLAGGCEVRVYYDGEKHVVIKEPHCKTTAPDAVKEIAGAKVIAPADSLTIDNSTDPISMEVMLHNNTYSITLLPELAGH